MIRLKVWMVCAFILWTLGAILLGAWLVYEFPNQPVLWWYPYVVGGTMGVGIGYTICDYVIKRLEHGKQR
jgi:hypothetical protein